MTGMNGVSQVGGVGHPASGPAALQEERPVWWFMGRILTYHPLPQLASGLCWILFHSWPLFPGLVAKAFFDALEGRTSDRLLGPLGATGVDLAAIVALVVALALVRAGFVYADVFAGTTAGFRLRGLLQRNLLARIFDRPGAAALPVTPGEAISTFRDDVETMWGAGWACDVVGFAIFAGGGVAILLWVDPRVTLLVFLPIVAVIVLGHVVRTRLVRLREESRAATARVTGSLGELFGAVQAIQVAGAEDRVVARLRRLGDERRDAMLRDRLLGLALDATFGNTAGLGAGLTLLVAARQIRSGEFTVGEFALFATYLMQVAEMTGFLSWIVATYQQMGVAFRRALRLLQGAPPETLVAHHPVPLAGPLPPVPSLVKRPADRLERLEVRGLTLRFPQSGGGIQDVSLVLERGSLTVVTGRIGAGKSTLLRALLGLLEPQAGHVLWNGLAVERPDHFFVPPRAAYVPQAPALLSGTLRENVLLGLTPEDPGELDARLERAVRSAVLERDLAGFPLGLDMPIGTRGVRLSGGQVQRVAAARALVREPELLVVDDLSSALDVETERRLWQRLAQRRGDLTILAVSHRPAVLQLADQVFMLTAGRASRRRPA